MIEQDVTDRFAAGVAILRAWGLTVEVPDIAGRTGTLPYLAGDDDVRRDELKAAWAGTARAVVAARGGHGCLRVLEDWEWPRRPDPPWLVGFSDLTALQWSLASIGVGSLHGPAVVSLAAEPDWSRERMRTILFGEPVDDLHGDEGVPGRASGRLMAANMAVATAMFGTRWMPNLDGAILVLEDVNESPFRVDRLFTQWRMNGIFDRVAALALGRFTHPDTDLMDEVLHDRVHDLGLPVLMGLPIGHDGPNAALPVGADATIDTAAGTLSIS